MKKVLIICNTYYQLITAIRLRETLLKNDKVDVVISDQSLNSDKIAYRLKISKIFNKVSYIKNKNICYNNSSIIKKLVRLKCVLFGTDYNDITSNYYDEMIYYNADIFIYSIFPKLILKNCKIKCSRYEEGVLSYADSKYLNDSYLKYGNSLRRMFNKEILDDKTKMFYCFYPEFYKGILFPIAIPKITDIKEIGDKLKILFNINNESLYIKEKFIFFTSVYDFEGGEPIGETQLVLKVADIVGKENIIVKTHPRDSRKIFEKLGIKTFEKSEIPWEAIQFNNDFSSKILLTVNSGSVLGANMILRNKAQTFFLYKCCNCEKNQAAKETIKIIEKFLKEMSTEEIVRINSLSELKNKIGNTDE